MQGINESRATAPGRLALILAIASVFTTLAALGSATRAESATPVCSAAELCAPSADPCTIAGTRDVASGCHLDFGTRSVVLTGALQSATTGGAFS